MKEEILTFLDNWFQLEVIAQNANKQLNREKAIIAIENMNALAIPPLHNQFGMTLSPPSELGISVIKKWNRIFKEKRLIYKLSHYRNDKLGDLFIVWVTDFYHRESYKAIGSALFITKIEGEWKIIELFGFDEDDPERPWFPVAGDEIVDFFTAGELIEIHRYNEPSSEEVCMLEYNKNY